MTPVRARRGRLVHAMSTGLRDTPPEAALCGRVLHRPVIVEAEVDCPACRDILERTN